MHERVAGELHVRGARERHVRRFLRPRPVRARAAGRERAQPERLVPGRTGDGVAGLDLGEALVGAGSQPRGVGELEPVEREVRRALAADEGLQRGCRDRCRGRVLAGARDVVDGVRGPVEVPLAGAVEQFERVLHVRRRDTGAAGFGSGVAEPAGAHEVGRAVPLRLDNALVGVVPAGLPHGDRAVGRDAPDRAADLGPGADAGGVDELDVALVAPARHRAAGCGVPGVGPRQGHRGGAPGAARAAAVDVELAGVEAGRHGRGPDVAGGVDLLPTGDAHAAAEDRSGAGRRGPHHVVAVGAGVAGGERERGGQRVRAVGQFDPHVAGHVLVEGAHHGLGPAGRADRRAPGGARVGVVSGRGDEHRGGGGVCQRAELPGGEPGECGGSGERRLRCPRHHIEHVP